MAGKNIFYKNILIDVAIISSIWGMLNNYTHKYFFFLGMTIYILKRYI
jgi:hypothetical protein